MGGAQLADQPGGMPGGAGRQLLSLQQHDVGQTGANQMIGHRAADDTAADDDGSAGERWVIALFDGGVKGVTIDMGDFEVAKFRVI